MSVGEAFRAWRGPRRVVWPALRERDVALIGLGILHTLGYIGFWLVMHLRSSAWGPGQVLEPLTGYWHWFYQTIFSEDRVMAVRRSPEAALHPFLMLAVMVAISGMYLLLLRWFRSMPHEQQPRLRMLMGFAVAASLPLLVLPNLLSSDIYSYIAFGRVAAVHGGNPFVEPPSTYAVDPLYRWVNWKHVASVYGPGWIYPSIGLTVIVNSINQHVITYVLAYKLLALALHLLNGVLIWSSLERACPEQRTWGTALYLLSPLALIEFVGNAHNDVLMITFILLGVWLHLRGYWYGTIAALTLAVLTKWIALPLLPLYGLALLWQAPTWPRGIFKAVSSLIIFAGLCIGLYRPYWEGWRTLEILIEAPPQQRMINSLGDVLTNDVRRGMWRLGWWPNPSLSEPLTIFSASPVRTVSEPELDDTTNALLQQQRTRYQQDRSFFRTQQQQAKANKEWIEEKVRFGALAILALTCLVAAAVTRTPRQALQAGAWVFFVYCSLGAVWFWPWYATWFVALAALLDWRVTGRTAIMLSLLVPLIYIFYPTLPDPVWWQRYRAVLVFGPPLLYAGWHGVRIGYQAWRTRRTQQTSLA